MPFIDQGEEKKKDEESGILGGITKNFRGLLSFANPAHQGAAIANVIRQQGKALPTAAGALLSGGNIKAMEESPLSFAYDTDNLRAQNAKFEQGNIGDKMNAVLGVAAPIVGQGIEGYAQTGINLGELAAFGISQTGRVGGPFRPMGLNETNYGKAYEAGEIAPVVIGDALNIALAGRGAAYKGSGGINPLPAATGERIASGAGALERNIFAPYTVPARGVRDAILRAGEGGTAFPRLANLATKANPAIAEAGSQEALIARQLEESGLPSRVTEAQQGLIDAQAIEAARVAREAELAANSPFPVREPVANSLSLQGRAARGEWEGIRNAETQARLGARDRLSSAEAALAAERESLLGLPENAERVPRSGLAGLATGALSEGAESLARGVGETWQTSKMRRNILGERSVLNQEFANTPRFEEIKAMEPAERAAAGHEVANEIMSQTKTNLVERFGQFEPFEGSVAVTREGKPWRQKANAERAGQASLFDDPELASANRPYYIPKSMQKAFEDLAPKQASELVRAWDKGIGTWKQAALPWSPRWHIGNVVGNTINAAVVGEMSLKDMITYFDKARQEMKNPTTRGATAVQGRGLTEELMGDVGTARTRPGALYQSATAKSFAINEAVDNLSHVMVYLKKLDEGKLAGKSAREAEEAAVNASLNAMGDFANMSQFERYTIRRVIPFYSWYKHMSKVAFRLPIDNPARVAWTMHLADMYGPEGEEEGNFLEGRLPLSGGGFMTIPGSPEAGDIKDNPLTSPKAALGAVAPPAQWIAASAGLNLGRGRELTAGPGQSWLSGAAGYAANQTPQTRMLADLIERHNEGGRNVAKSDTRAPILVDGKKIIDSKEAPAGIPPALFSFLTGASIDRPNLKEVHKRERDTKKSDEKKARKYERDVNKKKYKK